MLRPITAAAAIFYSMLLVTVPSSVIAADAEWKAGLARSKITPDQPVVMAGYAARTKPFEKVVSDLYVKALVLEDARGHRGVVISSDLLGFPADITEPICARIEKSTGLKREQVLINSSHTHTGPQLSLKTPTADDENSGEALRTLDYTRQLQDKVVAVVEQAAQTLEPVSLAWGAGVANFVMNRRQFTASGVILGDNPRGLADRSVPVLQILSAEGKLRAVLFGAAVHNTTPRSPDFLQICGDYAGFAQTLIQEKFPETQAMFLLGCAGDADPYPRGTIDLARQHGTALGEEVCRVLTTKLVPVRGPLQTLLSRTVVPLQPVPARDELQKLVADKRNARNWGAAQILAALDRRETPPADYSCPLALWQFGRDLTLVGLSGEVVVDYVPLIEQALGPRPLWIAAYCNDVFGYLPSARVLGEGGYETRGLYSGGAGFFAPDVQEAIVAAIRELAAQAALSGSVR
jgi:Neutral/alkaline non-lysosomal ceramidase, N-terminal